MTKTIDSPIAIAQNPKRLYIHAFWKRRVNSTTKHTPKNISPLMTISFNEAVRANNLAGGKAATSIRFNFL